MVAPVTDATTSQGRSVTNARDRLLRPGTCDMAGAAPKVWRPGERRSWRRGASKARWHSRVQHGTPNRVVLTSRGGWQPCYSHRKSRQPSSSWLVSVEVRTNSKSKKKALPATAVSVYCAPCSQSPVTHSSCKRTTALHARPSCCGRAHPPSPPSPL